MKIVGNKNGKYAYTKNRDKTKRKAQTVIEREKRNM